MNFQVVLKTLLAFFKEHEIDHALIGGVALNVYGIVRSTLDLDFLVKSESQERIIEFLKSLGYETDAKGDAFSQHHHPLSDLGNIDFIYISGTTAEIMFKESVTHPIFDNESIKVVKPEHLIALKLYAASCNPDRYHREMDDIGNLLKLEFIDIEEVKRYFTQYSSLDELKRLRDQL